MTESANRPKEEGSVQESGKKELQKRKRRKKKLTGKQKVFRGLTAAMVLIFLVMGARRYLSRREASGREVTAQRTAVAERRDILSSLSSSGSLSPKDT